VKCVHEGAVCENAAPGGEEKDGANPERIPTHDDVAGGQPERREQEPEHHEQSEDTLLSEHAHVRVV
jgi:hypothetical protein